MSKEAAGMKDIELILTQDDIKERLDTMLEKFPRTRYCLITTISEDGSLAIEEAGNVSGIEYAGLGVLLLDFCDGCRERLLADSEQEV